MTIVGIIIRLLLAILGGFVGVLLMMVGVQGLADSNTPKDVVFSVLYFISGFLLFIGTCAWVLGAI